MYTSPKGFVVDEGQPYTTSGSHKVSENKACMECQVQMFQSYVEGTPWQVDPGLSCLAFTFSGACDYDPGDGSFTYLTWGLSNRSDGSTAFIYDIRMAFSTIAFEPGDYCTMAEKTTWGAIKSGF
jgi:hypothetical protein